MTKEQHAQTLESYIHRLRQDDLEAITKQSAQCWYASLHYGISGQIEEQKKLSDLITKAIENMGEWDLKNIEKQSVGA
jgi:hypothetical protein